MVVQTRKRKAAEEQEAKEAAEAASLTSASKRQKKVPIRSKAEKSSNAAGPAKPTLITFDDDGIAKDKTGKAALEDPQPSPKTVEEPNDVESDEDEAPEAVSTVKAASDVKKASQAAQKASREKAAAEKQKRRERDTFLKKQADERRQAEEESTAAAAAALPPLANDDKSKVTPRTDVHHFPQGGRKRSSKIPIPDLLPAEYLTDSSSEDDEAPAARPEQAAKSLPKVRNVYVAEQRIARFDRGARDERIGSTVFRVVKESDPRLAPKMNGSSRHAKQMLLKRNRTAVKPGAGFFRKKVR